MQCSMARVHPTFEELVRLRFDARGFSLLPRQPVTSLLSGRYASRLRGRGLIFEELRDYRPGDDIRAMDWRATARLRKPHVRVYSEERERPVLLIVDQRTSMFFGSARATKATVAADLAALAAWRTVDVGDRIGGIFFSDEDTTEIRPHRSRSNVLRICHQLVESSARLTATGPVGDASTLNNALLRAVNIAKHDYLVIMITDFSGADPSTRELATRLAAHNDVIAALVYDPLGASLPARSPMHATDGRQHVTLPTDSGFQDRFQAAFLQRCTELRDKLRALRVPILPICTHDPVPDQVLNFLGAQR